VKRAFVTIAALLICGAIGSAARAQTPAQAAKYSRYLSNHPAVAANPGLGNVSSYMASYPGASNYSGAYQTQYMKNLATYNNYLATHPGFGANQGFGNSAYQTQYMKNLATYNNYMATHPGLAAMQGYGSPYLSGYPGQYPGQLASSPLTGLVAPFMSGYPAAQTYGGGYGSSYFPGYQPSYSGTSYGPQWGNDDDYRRWHHHHFDRDDWGYNNGGAYEPWANGGYRRDRGGPGLQSWHHHFDHNFAPAPQFNGPRPFGATSGAGRGWSSRPFASAVHGRGWGHSH